MKISSKDFREDNLIGTQWVGIVEDNADPLFEGRCKVRVLGKFDQRVKPDDQNSDFILPTENLPWARPAHGFFGGSETGSGMHSVPKINSVVNITFDSGNIYSPVYHFNVYPSDELKEEISGSYQNAHSLIYDTEASPGPIKLFFTEEKGLMLDYNDSQINIRPDNTVYIEHAGGKIIHIQNDKISLGKEGESDEPAVLGDKNADALNALADQINNLAIALQTFTTAQAAVTGAVFIFSPLTPALTALNAAMVPIITQIQAPIKSLTIPKTKSASISLDGPSKLV